MADQPEPAELARRILDTNLYMVLGTADEAGIPWVSPVYYAFAQYREFYWVSYPDARHSSNIAVRPQVSIVVFDSGLPVNTGQAVYMEGTAAEVTGAELEPGIEVFSHRSVEHGAGIWTTAKVQPPANLRLFRATVSEHSVLLPGGPDRRTPVTL